MNIDTQLTSSKIDTEQFYVQAQPLIQYGPLSLSQLKELYVNDVIDDNTFIATNSSLLSKNIDIINAFQIIPNETPLWTPIRSMHSIHIELENTSFKKRNSDNSDDSKSNASNLNFQLNINGNNVNTMDINMNITNSTKVMNISRKQIESLKFEIKLLEEKNSNLTKVNKDLQKQITTLNVKYQSQYDNLKAKMIKQIEDYKKKVKEQHNKMQSEINRLKVMNRNAIQNNIESKHIIKENEELSEYNSELKKKQNKLVEELSHINVNVLYYKSRCKALQTKYDLETFNYDKYNSNISELKEKLLQKQCIIKHSHQIINSLLKNTISDIIPYNKSLNEIEGNHNSLTHKKYSINREIIRLDALKISELIQWQNYARKFHFAMDMLGDYEMTSRRSRTRMKTVVNMLGEKVKSLNIHNLTPSELIHLSRDLKQSYESISSEQHLKEYELSNQRREFMKHKPMKPQKNSLSPMMSPMTSGLYKTTSNGTYLGADEHNEDHNYGISFSSMASLSMMDIQPGNYSRNQSLHSLSPSLDGTESIISKHRTKSGTIKGSGLKLLTDQDTLKSYLDPNKSNTNINRTQHSHTHSKTKSNKSIKYNSHVNNRSMSRSHSHRQLQKNHSHRDISNKKQNGIYSHYSAFKTKNKNNRRRHNKQSSISSNKSLSRSIYTSHHDNGIHRIRKDNNSMHSISALSNAGNLKDINESFDDDDDDDDASTVIMKNSPKTERNVTFDLDNENNGNGIQAFVPVNENAENDMPAVPKLNNKALSNDILSFFAM